MYAATGVLYENRIRASEVSTSVMFDAIGVSCIDAPLITLLI